jgi:hypothetical protein
LFFIELIEFIQGRDYCADKAFVARSVRFCKSVIGCGNYTPLGNPSIGLFLAYLADMERDKNTVERFNKESREPIKDSLAGRHTVVGYAPIEVSIYINVFYCILFL